MSSVTELLTLDQVAEHCHVSKRTIERLVKAGRIRTVRIANRPLVTSRELEAFIAASRHRA